MERQRTPQQPLSDFGVIESHAVDGRSDQRLAIAFYLLGRPQVSPAPTACVSTMERGTAERTALHRLRLKVEKQVLQLAVRVL
jgi:hypothetical protein